MVGGHSVCTYSDKEKSDENNWRVNDICVRDSNSDVILGQTSMKLIINLALTNSPKNSFCHYELAQEDLDKFDNCDTDLIHTEESNLLQSICNPVIASTFTNKSMNITRNHRPGCKVPQKRLKTNKTDNFLKLSRLQYTDVGFDWIRNIKSDSYTQFSRVLPDDFLNTLQTDENYKIMEYEVCTNTNQLKHLISEQKGRSDNMNNSTKNGCIELGTIFSEPVNMTYKRDPVNDFLQNCTGIPKNVFSVSPISEQDWADCGTCSVEENCLKNLNMKSSYNEVSYTKQIFTGSAVVCDEKNLSKLNIPSPVYASNKEYKWPYFKDKYYLERKFAHEMKHKFNLSKHDDFDVNLSETFDNMEMINKYEMEKSLNSVQTDLYKNPWCKINNTTSTQDTVEINENHLFRNINIDMDILVNSLQERFNMSEENDMNGFSSRKTLEVLYSTKFEMGSSCSLTNNDDNTYRSDNSDEGSCFEDSLYESEIDDITFCVKGESQSSLLQSSSLQSTSKDCQSFFEAKNHSKYKNLDVNNSSIYNCPEFRKGVGDVLENFLKENLLITNIKTDDFDVYIIPTEKESINSETIESNPITKLTSPNISDFSAQRLRSVYEGYVQRKPKKRKSRKKHTSHCKLRFNTKNKVLCKKYRNDISENSTSLPTIYKNKKKINSVFNTSNFPKVLSYTNVIIDEQLPSGNLLFNLGFSTHHLKPLKFKSSKSKHIVSQEDPTCLHTSKDDGYRNEIELHTTKQKRKKKLNDILDVLNDFKQILSELECRQNKLLEMFSCDPCGLAYAFPQI